MMYDDWSDPSSGAGADAGSSTQARQVLVAVVAREANELVRLFYNTFLQDEEASAFLSHSVVHDRLSHSLRDWLLDLLRADTGEEHSEFENRQRAIGEVHARIKIPIYLVLKGATLIKRTVARHLMHLDLDCDELGEALIMLDQRIDYAMRLMSQAYVSGTMRRAQIDESFRLFALGQDITLERESQRAALMEWSQTVLFALFGSGPATRLKPISSSPFGLWLYHRAGVMFQDAPALESIEAAMEQIDRVLLPKIEDARSTGGSDMAELLERLQGLIETIKVLLADLFQSAAGGDVVLRQIAEVILDTVRLSDFVFRYGGEEFLVALVETDAEQGFQVAEQIRQTLMARELHLSDDTKLSVTASIGLATYEGHPDYAYLVDAADKALYRSKEAGRNRVTTASC